MSQPDQPATAAGRRLPKSTPIWLRDLLIDVEWRLREHERPTGVIYETDEEHQAAAEELRSDESKRLRYALFLAPGDGDDDA